MIFCTYCHSQDHMEVDCPYKKQDALAAEMRFPVAAGPFWSEEADRIALDVSEQNNNPELRSSLRLYIGVLERSGYKITKEE